MVLSSRDEVAIDRCVCPGLVKYTLELCNDNRVLTSIKVIEVDDVHVGLHSRGQEAAIVRRPAASQGRDASALEIAASIALALPQSQLLDPAAGVCACPWWRVASRARSGRRVSATARV